MYSPHRIAPKPGGILRRGILLCAALTAGACVSPPQHIPQNIPLTVMPKEEVWEIIEHEKTGSGGLPEWVTRYLQDGSPSVEAMPEFAGRYVFVSEAEGVSLSALEQRLRDFDAPLDFPQLAALRVQRRLTVLGGDQPGAGFSRYQEEVVRALADAPWVGARREGDFWLLRSFAGEPGAEERESYLLLILLSFDQTEFRSRLDQILWQRAEDPEVEREQLVRRTRSVFYDNF